MKKKLSNFWYYYKWYVLLALLVIYVIGTFLIQLNSNVTPDAIVSIVTMNEVSETASQTLTDFLKAAVGDANGDGQTLAQVNVYHFDGQSIQSTNRDMFAADGVHLAAELQTREAVFYITDVPQLLIEDGGLQEAGKWQDFPALNEMCLSEFTDYSILVFDELPEMLR